MIDLTVILLGLAGLGILIIWTWINRSWLFNRKGIKK